MSMYNVGDKVLVDHSTVDGLRETVTITAVDEERGNEFYWAGKRGLFPQDIWCISNPTAAMREQPSVSSTGGAKNVKPDSAEPDPVNHPAHYTSDPSGIECIEITRHRNFNIGNSIKYLWRAGIKDDTKQIEDLKKAIWYITDEINRLEQI